jgi:hypothetical protein
VHQPAAPSAQITGASRMPIPTADDPLGVLGNGVRNGVVPTGNLFKWAVASV